MGWIENGVPFDLLWARLFFLTLKHGRTANQAFPAVCSNDQLRGLDVPTLLLCGDRGVICDVKLSARRAKALLPRVTVEIIPNVNHMTALCQPTLTNAAMLRFLEST
jgi:pimeloyl-ACP methyl ester carboxylesterase